MNNWRRKAISTIKTYWTEVTL